ncbi:MAG: DUF3021 domain-containing protein [Lachnospiraceae bacterium]|nr:DUF3021 domain-containing protein [Lachnospiraceae bacterium]
MNLKQRFIFKASVGFSLAVFISIAIEVVICLLNKDNAAAIAATPDLYGRIFMELLTAGILGVVGNGLSVVYEIENLGVLKPTAIHFFPTMLTYFIVGWYNGWLSPDNKAASIIQIVLMLVIYAVIWVSNYVIYGRQVAELNNDIALLKKSEGQKAVREDRTDE